MVAVVCVLILVCQVGVAESKPKSTAILLGRQYLKLVGRECVATKILDDHYLYGQTSLQLVGWESGCC